MEDMEVALLKIAGRNVKVVGSNLTGVFLESNDGVLDTFMTYETFKRVYGYDARIQPRK